MTRNRVKIVILLKNNTTKSQQKIADCVGVNNHVSKIPKTLAKLANFDTKIVLERI